MALRSLHNSSPAWLLPLSNVSSISSLLSSSSLLCSSNSSSCSSSTPANTQRFHSISQSNRSAATLSITSTSASNVSSSSSISSSSSCSSLLSSPISFYFPQRLVHNPAWMRGVGTHPKKYGSKISEARLARRITVVRAWQRLNPLQRLPILPRPGQTIIHHRPAPLEAWVYKFSDGSMAPMGIIQLNREIFGETVRRDIVQRVVHFQRRRAMRGTASTKTRGEVHGSRKKMWAQKKTGRARHGDFKAPHMHGGGTAQGPKPHSYEIGMPRKIRLRSTRIALTSKYQESRLFVVDKAELPSHRSLPFSVMMQKFGLKHEMTLMIWNDKEEGFDPNFGLAVRNQPTFDIIPSRGVNTYTLLRHRTVFITLSALQDIERRYHPNFITNKYVRYMVGTDGGGLTTEEYRKQFQQQREERILGERQLAIQNLYEQPPLHLLYTLKQLSKLWSNLGKDPSELEQAHEKTFAVAQTKKPTKAASLS